MIICANLRFKNDSVSKTIKNSMKKQIVLLAALLGGTLAGNAQKKGFDYKFYGQVRTDLFYNSRSNSETVDGLFYMYPLDKVEDPNGKDLNDNGNSDFYTLYTRLGVDVTGPMLGKAKTSAKVEVDFRGSGTTYSLFRIRHVYFNLDWGKSALLVGQTWHPLYGDVAPEILNLNMGAPYQPFSRAPQIRYRFTSENFRLTAAAIWRYLAIAIPFGRSQFQRAGRYRYPQAPGFHQVEQHPRGVCGRGLQAARLDSRCRRTCQLHYAPYPVGNRERHV